VALLIEVVMLTVDQGLIDVAADLLDEAELLAAERRPPTVGRRLESTSFAASSQFIEETWRTHVPSHAPPSLAHRVRSGESHVLNVLCIAASEASGYDEAREAALGSLEIATGLGNTETRAVDLGNLAEIELLAGNPSRRRGDVSWMCLAIALELGSLREVISSWVIAARLGRHER
jgi:hypothetical protein